MKSVAAGVVGIAVAGALGLGVFNLATTGCPLGTCSSEASVDAGSATLPVAQENEAGSCCFGDTKLELVADEGCSAEKMAACASDAEGCTAEKMAACQGEGMASEGEGAEILVVGAALTETEACTGVAGCCKADGCLPGGACCKDKASDE